MTQSVLTEHFFRQEYGRLVSSLSKQVGLMHIESIEDSVQAALLAGLETWTEQGLPESPHAWLHSVARNKLLSLFKQNNNQQRLLNQFSLDLIRDLEDNHYLSNEESLIQQSDTDLLHLLFVCCHPNIPYESQVVFALKSLCGFSTAEIALRTFNSEANVYKRYSRARQFLKSVPKSEWQLASTNQQDRLSSIHKVVYLIFTEGYLSVNNEFKVRKELCEEAIRLASLLVKGEEQQPETFALLALMNLHLARMSGRLNDAGGLLLLEEQDRSRWDVHRIEIGLQWLERSACGNEFSRYHAEAGIAAEHCLAASYKETNWQRIIECYRLVELHSPSSIHRLNCAVAIAEWKGGEAGLASLEGLEPPTWLAGSYLWFAVLADLNKRCGNHQAAHKYLSSAVKLAPTLAVKELLNRRHKN